MANQMIALQARAPQSSGLGGAVQQNAQLINMMMQQKAAERQTAQATQAMQLAQNKEARDVSAAEIDLAGKQIDYHYKRATAVNTPQGYQAWLAGVAKDSPEFAEFFVTNLPPEAFDRNALIRMVGSVKDNFDATYPKAEASLGYGLKGEMQNVITGGLPGVAGVFPLEEFTLAPPTARTGKVEVSEPTFADGGVGGPDMGANDLAGVASVLSNVNNDAEYQTVLNAIDAQNPQMAASIRQAMPRFDPQRMAGIRNEATAAFGGAGAPDQPGLVAGERGGVGGPYVSTGRQAMGKSPMQSPVPGVYDVSPGKITQTSGAEKTGEVEATRISDLRKAFPKAKSALRIATSGFDRDIADVDYVLANPYREMVLGNVEGAFPSATSFVNMFRGEAGQEAQNVQARLNKITSKSIITHLQEMRDASPQGSSLFGQVTEYEDRLVKALGGLEQSQDEATFERALRDYRKVLVEMRQNLPQVFNDTFGAIGAKERGTLPPSQPRKSPTISDVEYLRRNKNNPNVVNGFRQHFGDTAFKMAMGVR